MPAPLQTAPNRTRIAVGACASCSIGDSPASIVATVCFGGGGKRSIRTLRRDRRRLAGASFSVPIAVSISTVPRAR